MGSKDSKIANYEKQIYDLKQMLEISRSLNSHLEFSSLIESVLYVAMAQMRTLGVGLLIQENFESPYFSLQSNYTGLDVDPFIEYKISTTSPLIQHLCSIEDSCTIDELKTSFPEGSDDIRMLESLKPSLIVPLILKNRVNGILLLGERIILDESSITYSDYEIEEISMIASLSAIAINTSSLIEQTSTDMMTHLKLKYYFFNILTNKLDAAFSQNNDIGIIMLDIDFFKKFNDTYGHACGDYVLQNVAKIIKSSIRGEDLAARYGGEEFTVMLYNTQKEEALSIAERIRSNIESTDFFFQGQHMKVTISAGVSLFSVEDNPVNSAKTLVNQADKALYISKKNGRNQVTFADSSIIQSSDLED